ncbi:MAG: hypothetical protein ACM3OG_10575 [Actinomycetota bacterium]
MRFTSHDRHCIVLWTTVATLIILVSFGCLQSNQSKIIGSWKTQSINNTDGNIQYTLFKFHKEGGVSKKIVIINNENSSKQKEKIIGKYKFEDDKKNISIAWDDGNSEKLNVSFPQDNKMLLGKYALEKTE